MAKPLAEAFGRIQKGIAAGDVFQDRKNATGKIASRDDATYGHLSFKEKEAGDEGDADRAQGVAKALQALDLAAHLAAADLPVGQLLAGLKQGFLIRAFGKIAAQFCQAGSPLGDGR